MDKDDLISLAESGLSTYEIAKECNCSQTNVRYWLRKFSLNTPPKNKTRLSFLDSKNQRFCKSCRKELDGYKSSYCDNKCKHSFYYSQRKKINGNTNERQKEISKERKLKLIKMSGGCCEICGYNKNYSALCFHHLNPENKTFNLDSKKLSNTKWDSLVLEWSKCQLLCQNCHAEIHHPNNLIEEPGVEPGFRANLALNEV